MASEKVILLRQSGSDTSKVVKEALLSDPAPVWPLIVTAGELRKTSALRKLFEAEKNMAAIACYQDDSRKVTQVMAEEFRNRGITAEQGVLQMLSETLGNDRAITLQEIEKIDLYLGEDRKLTLQTAHMLCGDNRDHQLDELFNAICSGKGNLEDTLSRCFLEGLQPIGIYRMLSSHFQKIMSIQAMIANGMAQKSAFMRHGVFFKQEAIRE